MKIHFVDTQPTEKEYFSAALSAHDLHFNASLDEVDESAEVVSIYIRSRIDKKFLESHPSLGLIATRSNGVDHLDIAECARRGVIISTVHGAESNTVAEHTFALILALSRRLDEVRLANKQRHFYYDRLRSFDLKDKTIGVVGSGRIGLRVIHIALAFGMKAVAFDPHRVSVMAENMGLRYVSFDELLKESDVISLHVPLTAETFHLLDESAFSRCKHGVIIINTARGSVIDTPALIKALDSGIVSGAGLDVLEDESVMRRDGTSLIADQIISHLQFSTAPETIRTPERIRELQSLTENAQLISRPNVVFTPHIAFNSTEATERMNAMTVESILAFAAGTPANVFHA